MAITKPDISIQWASGGAIVEPSDSKKQTGWTAEVPPHQWENWIQNRQDQYLAHINERGIPEWDALTDYLGSGLSYVQGSDGVVYKSVAASGPSTVAQNPVSDVSDTYWTQAFAEVGAFISETEGDARYLQRSLNFSDIGNAATARSNLGAAPLASPAFTGTPTVPTAAAGTNTTQAASTAFVRNEIANHWYASAQQSIVSAGLVTLSHGLGAMPKIVNLELVCLVAENGYSVGDVVEQAWATPNQGSSPTGQGASVTKTSTTIEIRYGAFTTVFPGLNKSTGALANFTNANWALVVRAML